MRRVGMLAPKVISMLLRDLYAMPHFLKQRLCGLVGLARNVAHELQQASAIRKLALDWAGEELRSRTRKRWRGL